MTLRSSPDKPVYVRLREIISERIIEGQYKDGDPLPSVRAFAAEQGANPLTVAKAYQGFQDEGLIVVRRGVGMFVAQGARLRLGDAERRAAALSQDSPTASSNRLLNGALLGNCGTFSAFTPQSGHRRRYNSTDTVVRYSKHGRSRTSRS